MSHVEVPSLFQEVEGALITWDRNSGPRRLCKQTLLLHHLLTQAHTPLSCPLSTNLPFPCLNTTKASRFDHLSLIFLWGSNMHEIEFVFLLLICVMST